MSSPERKSRYSTCRPSLSYYKVFLLIFGTSSIISLTAVKYYGRDPNQFLSFQFFGLFISLLTYFGTFFLITLLKDRGFVGINLNDVETGDRIPEPGALLGCVLYILSMIFVQVVYREEAETNVKINPELLSISLMTLLGLIDDILRLNWSSKIIAPIIASIPLCLAHSENKIKFTKYFEWILCEEHYGKLFNGLIIVLLTVFCANSINIYAGINGLEVGQSLVMSVFIILYNSLEMYNNYNKNTLDLNLEKRLHTYYLTLPFIAVNVALICYNWYPARLFVGNIYTLFSGTFFSVIVMVGDLWEMVPFMFLPQLINFIISIPQLLGYIPCPRHRVPKFNSDTEKLENSKNYTLINLFLKVCGPMTEARLTLSLIGIQTFCCTLGLITKYCTD